MRAWVALRVVAFLVPSILAGCAKTPTKPVPITGLDPPVLRKGLVDDSPTWSHDGRWIAYHRGFPSTDGPAGVYIVSAAGGTPRLVTEGDFTGPRYLRFSPDDRQLAGGWGLQLVLIDVASGSVRSPLYTQVGASSPDWSPDGASIVYRRISYFPELPPDSTGIHILDVRDGSDRPLRPGPDILFGWSPRWSPDGSAIAFLASTDHYLVQVYRLKESLLTTIWEASPAWTMSWVQWMTVEVIPTPGLIFRATSGALVRTYLASPPSMQPGLWLYELGPWDAVSPDGQRLVLVRAQPSDSIGVLFTRYVSDPTGVTRRQLTSWTAPTGQVTSGAAPSQ